MAYSGDFGTSNQYIKFNLEIIENWQDKANNVSNVTVKLWARRTNTGYTTWGTGYVTLSVDGMNCDSGYKTIEITSTNTVFHSWTGNITHGNDGRKYLNVSGSIQIGGGILSSSVVSYGMWLSDIPRVSTFKLSTSSVNTGGSVTVTITKSHSSFTHNITYYRTNGSAVTIQPWDWAGTSQTFTIAASDAALLPNSTSGVAKVQVSTYSGSKLIGYTTENLTINVDPSVKPTLSGGISTSITNGAWGLCLKGKSRLSITANNPTGAHGSSIRSVTFSVGGYSSTFTSGPWTYVSGIMNSAGSQTITVTVTDTRGRSNSYTSSATVTDYYSPYFKSFEAVRCIANGTPDSNGTYIRISANLDYCKIGSNSGVVQYRFRESGGTWSSYVTFTNGTNTGAIGEGNIALDKTYDVEIKGADYFSDLVRPVLIPTMILPLDILAGGTGISIGKVATHKEVFDVNWWSVFRNYAEFVLPPIMQKGLVIRNEGHGLGHDEWWLSLKNNADKTKVGFTTGNNGEGLRIHNYDNNGGWLGCVDILKDNVVVNGNPIIATEWTANGRYIKYYNGWMECYKIVTVTTDVNTVWGNIYASGYKSLGGWAYNFTSVPNIYVSLKSLGSSAFIGGVKDVTANSAGSVELYRGAWTTGASFEIQVVGTGWWKNP